VLSRNQKFGIIYITHIPFYPSGGSTPYIQHIIIPVRISSLAFAVITIKEKYQTVFFTTIVISEGQSRL